MCSHLPGKQREGVSTWSGKAARRELMSIAESRADTRGNVGKVGAEVLIRR